VPDNSQHFSGGTTSGNFCILTIFDFSKMILKFRSSYIEDAISELLKVGAKNVFVTIGDKGTIYATSKKREVIKSIKVKVIDTTGAGDAFIGALLGQLSDLKKKEINFEKLKDFVKIANIAAALTITKKGALESIPNASNVMKLVK